MLFGRFFMIMPMLAIAGSLGRKKRVPPSLGTFPVTTPLFTALLVGVIVIVGALTFFPALSLGPIVEHFLMHERTGVLNGDASQASRPIWDPQIVRRAVGDALAQAAPAHDGAEPGDVRRRGRQRADDAGGWSQDAIAGRAAASASSSRSRSGCG